MKILGIIPARAGSKEVKDKNSRLLAGKPVIQYTIEAAQKAKTLDRIVVSTENAKIARIARSLDIQVIMRPQEYSKDDSPIYFALRHAVRYLMEKEKFILR